MYSYGKDFILQVKKKGLFFTCKIKAGSLVYWLKPFSDPPRMFPIRFFFLPWKIHQGRNKSYLLIYLPGVYLARCVILDTGKSNFWLEI